MSSTKISDLPDSGSSDVLDQEVLVKARVPNVSTGALSDTLVVFALLLGATNNELSKSVLRFPLLKLQKSDLLFNLLLSVIFSVLFLIYKML